MAQFPGRLVGFCGVNPLRDYALEEIARCARDPHLRTGLKLHFANSDVDVENPQHVERARRVPRRQRKSDGDRRPHTVDCVAQRPYGAAQARAFLDNVLSSAPESSCKSRISPVPAATMIPKSTRRSACTLTPSPPAIPGWRASISTCPAWLASANGTEGRPHRDALRQLGIGRILYGSDSAVGAGRKPAEAWASFRELPLSREEFRTIAANVAPYLQ